MLMVQFKLPIRLSTLASGKLYFSLLFCGLLLGLSANIVQAKIPNSHLVEKRYKIARAYYHNLQTNNKLSASRSNWLYCARTFSLAFKASPRHNRAPASLITLGHIYRKMYNKFGDTDDIESSLANYKKLANRFPKHRFADDALFHSAQIIASVQKDYQTAARILAKLIAVYHSGDMVKKAAIELKVARNKLPRNTRTISQKPQPKPQKNHYSASTKLPRSGPLAKVVKLRHWSTKSYTRVVIETDAAIQYRENILKNNSGTPHRLYLNLFNSQVNKTIKKSMPVNDGLLQQVRSAQFDPNTVRVVLDTESMAAYNIFSLHDPFRIVIDIKGDSTQKREEPQVHVPSRPSLAQQLGLGIKRIFIDPGHGGKDPGAIGINKLREKDIVLNTSKILAKILREKLGSEVILTRGKDTFVRLEERTAIANSKDGDLFISIHANSAPNPKAHGVETYYLSMASTKEEMRVAARENSTTTNKISDLQDILKIMQNSKIEESAKLAAIVQKNMIKGLGAKYNKIGNKGVKKAPFIVLVGAQMPAILTEIAFMSNETDARRLTQDSYLRDVATYIAEGIIEYSKVLNMAQL